MGGGGGGTGRSRGRGNHNQNIINEKIHFQQKGGDPTDYHLTPEEMVV